MNGLSMKICGPNIVDTEDRSEPSMAECWEGKIRDLLWLSPNTLHPFFVCSAVGQQMLERMTRSWFLPRYDRESVSRLNHVRVSTDSIENMI